MYSEIINKAGIIWNYLYSFSQKKKSEVVAVCCSYDLRVCDYACDLYKKNESKVLLFSGNRGNWTDKLWSGYEAEIFRERAIKNGINPSSILTEKDATNIGENISFSRDLLKEYNSITFVSKPNTILRVKLTAPIHIDDKEVSVSSPEFNFPEDVSNIVGVYGVINEMIGDIERIMKYPALGFQIKHNFPDNIIKAYKFLINRGFTEHMMEKG